MIVGFNAIKFTYMCLSRNFVRFIKEKFIDKNFPKCWMGSLPAMRRGYSRPRPLNPHARGDGGAS